MIDPFLSKTSAQVLEWSPDGSVRAAGINDRARIDLFDPDLRTIRSVDLGEGGDAFDLPFSPAAHELRRTAPMTTTDISTSHKAHFVQPQGTFRGGGAVPRMGGPGERWRP